MKKTLLLVFVHGFKGEQASSPQSYTMTTI